jgi:hypothetical protein
MKKFNKKAIAGPLVDFFAYVFFALVIILFYVLFYLGKGQMTQSINSEFVDARSHFTMMNYLNTPVGDKNIIDLAVEYCSKEPADDIIPGQLYRKAIESLDTSTTTAKLVCSKNKAIELRKPICKEPRNITIPSYNGIIYLFYCPSIDNAEKAVHPSVAPLMTSPDGKKWHKLTFDKVDYYLEDNTENLISANNYDKKYAGYSYSQDNAQKIEEFKQKILAGQNEIFAPNGNKWRKVSDKYCVFESQGSPVSCELNIWSKEEIISNNGNVPVKR